MLPLVAWVPLQPPEALHELALLEAQVSVVLLPVVIDAGLAPNDTVGAIMPAPAPAPASPAPPPPQAARDEQAIDRTSGRSNGNMGTAGAPGQAMMASG